MLSSAFLGSSLLVFVHRLYLLRCVVLGLRAVFWFHLPSSLLFSSGVLLLVSVLVCGSVLGLNTVE